MLLDAEVDVNSQDDVSLVLVTCCIRVNWKLQTYQQTTYTYLGLIQRGWTALHFAAAYGRLQCCKELVLSPRLDVHARDNVSLQHWFSISRLSSFTLNFQEGREAVDIVCHYVFSSISDDDESLSSAIEETLESPYMVRLRVSQTLAPS